MQDLDELLVHQLFSLTDSALNQFRNYANALYKYDEVASAGMNNDDEMVFYLGDKHLQNKLVSEAIEFFGSAPVAILIDFAKRVQVNDDRTELVHIEGLDLDAVSITQDEIVPYIQVVWLTSDIEHMRVGLDWFKRDKNKWIGHVWRSEKAAMTLFSLVLFLPIQNEPFNLYGEAIDAQIEDWPQLERMSQSFRTWVISNMPTIVHDLKVQVRIDPPRDVVVDMVQTVSFEPVSDPSLLFGEEEVVVVDRREVEARIGMTADAMINEINEVQRQLIELDATFNASGDPYYREELAREKADLLARRSAIALDMVENFGDTVRSHDVVRLGLMTAERHTGRTQTRQVKAQGMAQTAPTITYSTVSSGSAVPSGPRPPKPPRRGGPSGPVGPVPPIPPSSGGGPGDDKGGDGSGSDGSVTGGVIPPSDAPAEEKGPKGKKGKKLKDKNGEKKAFDYGSLREDDLYHVYGLFEGNLTDKFLPYFKGPRTGEGTVNAKVILTDYTGAEMRTFVLAEVPRAVADHFNEHYLSVALPSGNYHFNQLMARIKDLDAARAARKVETDRNQVELATAMGNLVGRGGVVASGAFDADDVKFVKDMLDTITDPTARAAFVAKLRKIGSIARGGLVSGNSSSSGRFSAI